MINYVIKKKKNPSDRSAPEKYYLHAKALGSVKPKDLIEDMVENTSMTEVEATTELNYLMRSIVHFLKLGFSVKLGDFGYFHTSLKSEGVEKEKDARLSKLKAVKIRFVPGKAMKMELANARLEKAKFVSLKKQES